MTIQANNIYQIPQVKQIDIFCGGGGFSSGAAEAEDKDGNKICEVIAGVNHDPVAIASHKENHPNTRHFKEDVKDHKVVKELGEMVRVQRILFPNAYFFVHASLECTHFSIAKGGDSRDPDSRSLPEYMPNYVDAIKPEAFTVENVREFISWGPLIPKIIKVKGYSACKLTYDKEEKRLKAHLVPESKNKGKSYIKWVNQICDLGYDYKYKMINSADHGANTSRTRYFGVFMKKGLPIHFPRQTHEKNPKPIGGLLPWNPIKPCLDLSDKGESIFTRPIELVENTLKRVLAGLIKQVAKGDKSFIMKYYSSKNPADKCYSLKQPAGAITTIDHHALVNCEPFIMKYLGNNQKTGVNNGKSLAETCIAITTQNRISLVSPDFIDVYYGKGYSCSLSDPSPVLTTNDRLSYVSTHTVENFMSYQYSNGGDSSLDKPCWSITTNPKANLVTVDAFNENTHVLIRKGSLKTAAVKTKHVEKKHPVNLVLTDTGYQVVIEINQSDSETMKQIKYFMAYYGIADIKTRMLKVSELKIIQGFHKNYILKGSETKQKKAIGNAVVPVVAKKLIESLYEGLMLHKTIY